MTFTAQSRAILLCLALAPVTTAQYGPGGRYGPPDDYGPGGGYGPGDNYGPFGGNSNGNGPFGGLFGNASPELISTRRRALIAHGVLASLAFVLLFPAGSIFLRLSTWRHTWLLHGLFQLFAYVVYIAAFGIAIWLLHNLPINLLDMPSTSYHPIIGIILLIALFFMPILGAVHHAKFKKLGRRTGWSYAHLWLGRATITLGMINGGLGLLVASRAPAFTNFAPSRAAYIAYGVVASLIWLLWVASAVYGERRRKTSLQNQVVTKDVDSSDSEAENWNVPAVAHRDVNAQTGVPPPYETKEQYAHRWSSASSA